MELHTDADVTGIGEVNVCIGSNPEVIRAMTEQMAELFVGDTPAHYYIQAQSDLDAMVGQTRDAVERGFGTIYFKVAIEEERDVWSSSGERPGAHPGRAPATCSSESGQRSCEDVYAVTPGGGVRVGR